MVMAPPALEPDAIVSTGAPTKRATSARLRTLLRSIRVDAQDLRRSLTNILAVADGQAATPAAVAAALEAEEAFRAKNVSEIATRFSEAEALLGVDPDTGGSELGDQLTAMQNGWERMLAAWPPVPDKPSDIEVPAVRHRIIEARGFLDELIFTAAQITIPSRLVESLSRLRVGGRLDFHQAFGDELSELGDRTRLLEYLARYPGSFPGLIDVETGTVFRIARGRGRRLGSYALMALAILGGVVLILALTAIAPPAATDWRFAPARLPELLAAYGALIAGAVAHIGVDAIKQYRADKGSMRLLAMEDLFLWGHVRELSIVISIVSLWVVMLGLAAFLDEVPIYTAFLAGYSADSVLDIFLARFTTGLSSQASTLMSGLAKPAATDPGTGGRS